MALDKGEIKRRIEAARTLRNITQKEMDRRGHALGLNRQELSRTERGVLDLTESRRMVLEKVLKIPPAWFGEEDVDVLLHSSVAVEVKTASTETVSTVPMLTVLDGLREQGLSDEQARAAAQTLARALLEGVQADRKGSASDAEAPGAPGQSGRGAGGAGG